MVEIDPLPRELNTLLPSPMMKMNDRPPFIESSTGITVKPLLPGNEAIYAEYIDVVTSIDNRVLEWEFAVTDIRRTTKIGHHVIHLVASGGGVTADGWFELFIDSNSKPRLVML